jgi:D-alanyl-lipoteichoic acid acyltransferase DltB (MBOAT superfamily)
MKVTVPIVCGVLFVVLFPCAIAGILYGITDDVSKKKRKRVYHAIYGLLSYAAFVLCVCVAYIIFKKSPKD